MKKTLFISMLTAALAGSAYANTDCTATPGATQSSLPDYVYGTYADTGEASGGYVEVREVSAPEGYECLYYVYGGYVHDTGDAIGNTVTMTGGEVGDDVCGGYVLNIGDATGNTVTMSGGEVGYNVYGGCLYSGNATENAVTINDGYVNHSVYGGFLYSGDATENAVTINDGYVDNEVYGGYVEGDGDATGNTVTIAGSEVGDEVYGGYAYSGNATENAVTINDGYVDFRVYGSYVEDSGDAIGNTVTMTGGEVGDDVYGGFVDTGDAIGNTVTMTGGEVGDDVYGGYTFSGNATGNAVDMTGGEIYGYVYGGYTYSGNANENAVTINDGYVDSSVYGGYTESGDASNNIVVMRGGQVEYLEGGDAEGDGAANNNTVVLNGGLVVENLHAGLHYGNGDACNNTSIITGGEVQGWAMGAYREYEGAARDNSIHLVGRGATAVINGETYTGSEDGIKLGYVYAAYSEGGGELTGNSINIHGTGTSTGEMGYMQILTFHLGDGLASANTPMLTITNTGLDLNGVQLGFYGDAVTDWAAFNGKSVTLVGMTNETITGLVTPTDPVDITDEAGNTVATSTLELSEDGKVLTLTNIQGVTPVPPPPPPVPTVGPDALDVTLVNSLWASSAYVREFVRLAESQGYALKAGDTAVWGGGFGAFMHATGDRGFKSDGGGYGIGVNHAFSANTRAGISLGQGFGSYHNSGKDGAHVHQRAILAAATASTRIGKDLSLGAHLAFGSVRNRADCRLDGATERARWNDNVFNLGAQAAYDFHVTERTAITPFLGLDWAYGAHESFTGGYARHYSHGRLNELRMPVGVTVSTATEVGSTKLLPQLSVAYVPSLAQQVPHANVSSENGNYRVKGYAPGRNAFMLNVGVNAVFSDSWSAGAFYTLETRSHSVDQSVNASVRYTF